MLALAPSPQRLAARLGSSARRFSAGPRSDSGGGPASPIMTPPLPPRHGAPDSTAGVRFCVLAHHGVPFTGARNNVRKTSPPNKSCANTNAGFISRCAFQHISATHNPNVAGTRTRLPWSRLYPLCSSPSRNAYQLGTDFREGDAYVSRTSEPRPFDPMASA